MSGGILIVGAGQAAVHLASTLRDRGFSGPLTIVGDEPHLPYQRPPLSKAYLLGTAGRDSLAYRNETFFAERDIDVVTSERVVEVERVGAGGRARTDAGTVIEFDRLVLATGAAPRPLSLPGVEASGVLFLRDIADADALRERAASAREAVVIGGGFIGLEAAASMHKMGTSVTVLEAAPALMGRAVGPQVSAYFLAVTRARGIRVVIDARIRELDVRDGSVNGVILADGTRLPADLVVVGVGVVPRTELAEQLGLEVANGVVVDEHAVASDGWTLAIGDCANVPNPYPVDPGTPRVRLESVNNAVEQAAVAAATILGERVPYRSVPWFWSDQADTKLQIAGLSIGHDEVIVRGDPTSNRVSFLYLREGRLIAADCINSPADFAAVRSALAREVVVDRTLLADTSVRLSTILAAQPVLTPEG